MSGTEGFLVICGVCIIALVICAVVYYWSQLD